MNRQRYKNISDTSIRSALRKLRISFVSAKSKKDVDELIFGLLTHDERIKVGRRIQIAEMLLSGKTYLEIRDELGTGKGTVLNVLKKLDKYPQCYKLIISKDRKNKNLNKKNTRGGSKQIFKLK